MGFVGDWEGWGSGRAWLGRSPRFTRATVPLPCPQGRGTVQRCHKWGGSGAGDGGWGGGVGMGMGVGVVVGVGLDHILPLQVK